MSARTPCSAYQPGQLCKNGFPQSAACGGFCTPISECPNCGHAAHVPMCLRDEVPAHLVDERGMPRYSLAASQAKEGGAA